MNPKPISNRKKVQLVVALTLLAWATQTLLHQWARGAEPPTSVAELEKDNTPAEHFVPNVGGVDVGAVLEMKSESTIHGGDIQLRQICRWADADGKYFAPMADLVVARFDGKSPFQSVPIEDLRQILHDSGATLALIRFAGATSCTVSRSDVKYDEAEALQQWADAREGKTPATTPLSPKRSEPATLPLMISPADLAPAAKPATPAGAATDGQSHTLRELILADASVRLTIPAEQLQINFNPADDHILNLAEPQFRFNLEAHRVFGLGDVEWNVLIVTDSEQTNAKNKKIPILATARAWQRQVTLVKPIAFKQVIQKDDVVEKRVLVDHVADDTLLTLGQCIGQESLRDLKPGMIMTARLVNPVDLAKVGQFITVSMSSGGVRIKTVGRAMEAGTFGQTIKVKNEATEATYEVVLTGPQEGSISPAVATLDR